MSSYRQFTSFGHERPGTGTLDSAGRVNSGLMGCACDAQNPSRPLRLGLRLLSLLPPLLGHPAAGCLGCVAVTSAAGPVPGLQVNALMPMAIDLEAGQARGTMLSVVEVSYRPVPTLARWP
jgi:hypothetical protein